MQAEFEVLSDDGNALPWAWGAFATALRWRLQADAPFLALLSIAPLVESWITTQVYLFLTARLPINGAWMEPLGTFEAGLLFVLSLGLALVRPKLAALSALVVAFIGPAGLITWTYHQATGSNPLNHFEGALVMWTLLPWTKPDNPALNNPHVHNWQLGAMVVWHRLGPCVYGAIIGFGIAWLATRLLEWRRRPA